MSWIAVSVAVSVGTTALSAYGQYQSAEAANDAAKAQSKLDQQRAQAEMLEDSRAEAARTKAMRDEARRNRASMEAGYAASGVVLEGSPAEILTKQAEVDELNVQREHQDGNRRRELMEWGSGQQANLDKFASKQRSRAASLGAVAGMGQTANAGFQTYRAWV